MKPLRVAEDFVPISEFKAQASEWLRRVAETGTPLVVTQNGRPAGVLLSPRAFDELTETTRFLSSIREGLADVEAGRLHEHAEVLSRLKARIGQRSRD